MMLELRTSTYYRVRYYSGHQNYISYAPSYTVTFTGEVTVKPSDIHPQQPLPNIGQLYKSYIAHTCPISRSRIPRLEDLSIAASPNSSYKQRSNRIL